MIYLNTTEINSKIEMLQNMIGEVQSSVSACDNLLNEIISDGVNAQNTCSEEQTHGKGVIYILSNPSQQGYIKLGYTKDLQQRIKQLNSSDAVPEAFRAYAVYEVNTALRDKDLHRLIEMLNPNLRSRDVFNGRERVREFYRMTPEEAYSLLECIAKISGTEDNLKRVTEIGEIVDTPISEETSALVDGQQVELNPIKNKKWPFSAYGISIGATLTFVKDTQHTVTVVSDNAVELQGEQMSISLAAQKLLNSAIGVQGPRYFTYNGKRLTDIRKEIEEQSDISITLEH